jgi:ATP-binding cassette subfamily F protein uup
MAAPLLILQNIGLTFGGTPLLTQADLSVSTGERVALVGRNGSGKSTLLKVAAGLIEQDSGERTARNGATIRYLPQEPDLTGFATTLAYVEAGMGPGDQEYRALYLLNELGLTGEENPASLSGGEVRRAALARVLAPEPDVLLLDEPTNHLDLPAIAWLESELASLKSALVLISHDRRFLETLSRATVWLDRGKTRRSDQGFSSFETWRDAILEEEERDRHKLDRKIAAEEDWMRYGVTARRKRNVRRVGELATLRQERKDGRRATGSVNMTVTEAEKVSGKLVIETIDASKSYGERPIVSNFSTRIARGDRIGLVGPNGAGKTTMLNLLTGALEPDSGKVRLGANIEMVTLDQRREALDPEMSLSDTLTGGRGDLVHVGEGTKHVIGYMKDFLFTPEQARTPVRVLSGGERARLMLARALAKPANLLVLDEPTNDLDLETLDLLQEMLADHPGTVLLVSHDRDFIDRVVSSVIVSEGEGKWVEYAGGYSDMLVQRGEGVTARKAASAPKPIRAEAAPKAAMKPKGKLTFEEQHALKSLPKRIATLEAEIVKLEASMADPKLFASDPAAFNRAAEAATKARAELTDAEEQWLEVEMKREELGL